MQTQLFLALILVFWSFSKAPAQNPLDAFVGDGTLLMAAAQQGQLEEVKSLVKRGAGLNIRGRDGTTALMRGAMNCRTEVVKFLLEAGAEAGLEDFRKQTATTYAQANGCQELAQIIREAETKQLIESQFPDINQQQKSGQTFLTGAIKNNDLVKAGIFLKKGADPNAPNVFGETPLNLAAQNGNLALVKTLLEAGADPDNDDYSGNTPLELARKNKHQEIVTLLAGIPKKHDKPNTGTNDSWGGIPQDVDARVLGGTVVVGSFQGTPRAPSGRTTTRTYRRTTISNTGIVVAVPSRRSTPTGGNSSNTRRN